MSYTVDVKVIALSSIELFEQRCSELETELQDESVYQYATEYSIVPNGYSVLYTAIYRIYYEVIENPVALGYGGTE